MGTGKMGPDGKELKKIALVQKKTPPKELFNYLIQLLGPYPYHSFLAKWQREQFDKSHSTSSCQPCCVCA